MSKTICIKKRKIEIRVTDSEYMRLNLAVINRKYRNMTDLIRDALNRTVLKPTKPTKTAAEQ